MRKVIQMKRFVKNFTYYDQYGDKVNVCDEINEYACKQNLIIVTISHSEHGMCVVFEEDGAENVSV